MALRYTSHITVTVLGTTACKPTGASREWTRYRREQLD